MVVDVAGAHVDVVVGAVVVVTVAETTGARVVLVA